MSFEKLGELVCKHAALILHESNIAVSEENIDTLLKAANANLASYWPKLSSEYYEDKKIEDDVEVGFGGGAAAALSSAGAVKETQKLISELENEPAATKEPEKMGTETPKLELTEEVPHDEWSPTLHKRILVAQKEKARELDMSPGLEYFMKTVCLPPNKFPHHPGFERANTSNPNDTTPNLEYDEEFEKEKHKMLFNEEEFDKFERAENEEKLFHNEVCDWEFKIEENMKKLEQEDQKVEEQMRQWREEFNKDAEIELFKLTIKEPALMDSVGLGSENTEASDVGAGIDVEHLITRFKETMDERDVARDDAWAKEFKHQMDFYGELKGEMNEIKKDVKKGNDILRGIKSFFKKKHPDEWAEPSTLPDSPE